MNPERQRGEYSGSTPPPPKWADIHIETAWYKTKVQNYGLILDTRNTWAKTGAHIVLSLLTETESEAIVDWITWIAAISDNDLKHKLIDGLIKYASNGLNNAPYGDLYFVPEGRQNGFRARPVAGGHLALVCCLFRYQLLLLTVSSP